MRCINWLVNASFKTTKTGDTIFSPCCNGGKMYKVLDPEAEIIKKFLSKYYLIVFISIVISPVVLKLYSALLVPISLVYYYFAINKILKQCQEIKENGDAQKIDSYVAIKMEEKNAVLLLIVNVFMLFSSIVAVFALDMKVKIAGIIVMIYSGIGMVKTIYLIIKSKRYW